MANVINTTLRVNADTSQAKASLQDLQSQLQNLASVPVGVDATGLQSAKNTILELGQNLRTAMNPNTGKLDLSVFSRQLKEQNRSILDYKNALFSMGTQGQQAFLSLANSIAAAEAPTNRLNAKLIKFGQTIKNTINWQLSSMMIHGVMGQIQGAINYAEKLNQSLNNIQIITGQNNEKMAEFAKQANQTARQLSTTTTEYTNASLIYYQQGLNDKQVAERTETTLKLANVTRQSAQEVSNELTAIWNNFDDGTTNLEHYADVITALGAATASSSAEIANGLQKFAAVAKTVGLSYDYATTALATIVATTRQSEDTVGTGLRTLFARLEGLKLGETLEDGVSLNKYSSALASVGVNIQDQYGQIKDMDQILDELGAKWGTISKEQQIALAQTVGGVRQYTNLIALMDNWQFFQRNLQIAQGADGTLQTQAERYAEGWEAARKRVRTATEGIYDALIDDQAIIKVTNVFAGFLDVINGLVAGFGGLKGIIPIVGALLMNNFAKNAPQFFMDIGNNFRALSGRGVRDMTDMQGNLTGILQNIQANSTDEVYKAQLQKIIDTNIMNRSLAQNATRMSESDQAAYRFQMAAREAQNDALIYYAQQKQQNDKEYSQLLRGLSPSEALSPQAYKQAYSYLGPASNLQKNILPGLAKARDEAENRQAAARAAYTKMMNSAEVKNLQAQIETQEKKLSSLSGKAYDEEQFKIEKKELNSLKDRLKKLTAPVTAEKKEAEKAFVEANKKYEERATKVEETFKTLEKAKTEAEAGDALLKKNGLSREELLKDYDLQGQLKGRAITRDNIMALREGGILTSKDNEIIEKANAAYLKEFVSNRQDIGFVKGAQKKLTSFQEEVKDLLSPENGKIDQKAFEKKATEFADQWGKALKDSNIQEGTEKALHIEAKSLMPTTEEIEQAGGDFSKAFQQKMSTIQTNMSDYLKNVLGKSDNEISNILGKLGFTSTDLNKAGENAEKGGETTLEGAMNGKPGAVPLAQASQGAAVNGMLAASSLTSMMSAVNTASNALVTAMDDSATGAQKFGAIISSLSTLLMTFAMTTRFANTAMQEKTLSDIASSGLGKFQIGEKTLGSVVGGAGMLGIYGALASLAIGLIKGFLERREQTIEEARQEAIDTGNETYEKLTSSSTLIQSQNNLINAYNAAAKAVQEGTATEKELQQAKQDLISSLLDQTDEGYSNANAVAYAYAGNMVGVQTQIDINRLLQIQQSRGALIARQNAVGQQLSETAIKNTGQENRFAYQANTKEAKTIMEQVMGRSRIGISANDTPENLYQFYKQAIALRDAYIAADIGTDNQDYKRIAKIINTLSESAEAYGKYKDQIEELDIEALALGDTLDAHYLGNANLAIKDVKTYNDYRQKLIDAEAERLGYLNKDSEEYKSLERMVDAYLGTITSVTGNDLGNLQYISTGIENVIEYQSKRQNLSEINQNTMRNSLIKAYETYGDAIFQIGTRYEIPINFENPDKKLKSVLDLLQSTAEKNKIQVQIELASNFNLGATSTSAEWAKFVSELDKELWVATFGEGFNLSTFSGLSSDARQEMLQQYISASYDKLYEPGGVFDTDTANLYNQQALDIENKRKAATAKTYAYNAEVLGYGKGTIIDTNLPYLESLYNDLYDENGQLKAGATISKEDTEKLASLGLSHIDAAAIAEVHKYAEAVQAYNEATLGLEGTNKLIEENETALEAWLATGFRQKLAGEAEAFGLNYDEIQQYASALRDQGLFQQPDAMSEEEYLAKHNELMQTRSNLLTQQAEGTITTEEYNSQMNETITALQDLEEEYHADIKASEEFAIAQMRLEKGIGNLQSNWKTWQKTLKSTTKNSWENTQAFIATRKAVADILGLPTKDITADFIEAADAVGALDKAATGTKEGLEYFQQFAAEFKMAELFKLDPKQFTSTTELHNAIMEQLTSAGDGIAEAWSSILAGLPQLGVGDLIEGDLKGNLDTVVQSLFDAGNDINGVMDFLSNAGIEANIIPAEGGGEGTFNAKATGVHFNNNGSDIIPEEGESITYGTSQSTDITAYSLEYRKKGSGGGGSKGGGGGGKKKKDHKKPDTGTRYHTIKAKQANNSQNKQEVNRQKERAFGAEKIKQAQKEIDLQKESLELQRQYIDEITDYLAGDRKNMEDAFKGLGISLNIDDNGVITNFREVEEELLRQENELIDQYNDGPLDDEAYQEAQKKIDEAREYLKIYEETRDLYEEQMIAMIELLDGLQDQLLELTKTKIEIQIDISDEKLDWLEYMLEKIGDDAYQAAEAIAFLGDKTGETLNRIDIYQAGLEEILGRKGFSLDDLDNLTDLDLASANFTQAEIDQIREWKSELMDANKELLKMREEVINKVIDGFDKLNEKVKNSYDNFNQYNDVLEKYKEITDLLGLRLNQQNKELLDSLGKATLANAQNQAASAKAIYETAKQANEDAQRTYQEMVQRYGKNSPEAQQWENLINTTQDALDEAQNNWLEAWDNALQIAQDIYINHIEQITKTFEEQVSGLFGSLDYLQSAFDRANQTNDQYLQDFEKLYELNKLNRDIQKEIDDTNSLRNKKALRDMQKELNDLQEQGVKLSQYDVDAARKRFELEMARQAIEDARNNRSEVRLQRDANGNWGYVYTAMEDEVDAAEQEYENKLYEYQKLNDDYIQELQSRVLETQATYKDALAEIYNDTSLTDEQRQARIDELNAWKDSELAYFEDQLNNALENQQNTLDLYYKLYNTTNAELADSWHETTLSMLSGADSVEEYINNVRQAMLDMLNSSASQLQQYLNDVDDSNTAAGVNTEDYSDHVIGAIAEIGEQSEQTQQQILDLSNILIDEFVTALQEAVNWEDEYANKMKAAIEQNEKFIQSLNEMIARLAIIESNDPELKIARANYMLAEANHEKFVQKHGDVYDADWEKAKQSWQEFLDKYADAAQYDTGGYTGSWGSEGRMAILHEKENVFNAEDTSKLLDAAYVLRSIDLSAKTFATGLGQMLFPQLQGFTQQVLDQNVHIDATFPNVTDHNEIELAFDNLINKATQYANRKNMSSMTFQDMYTSKF